MEDIRLRLQVLDNLILLDLFDEVARVGFRRHRDGVPHFQD